MTAKGFYWAASNASSVAIRPEIHSTDTLHQPHGVPMDVVINQPGCTLEVECHGSDDDAGTVAINRLANERACDDDAFHMVNCALRK